MLAWSSEDLFRQYFRLHSLLSCLLDTQWVNPLPEDLLKRVTEQRARLEELGKNRPEEHKQELNRGAKQEEHKEAEGPKPEAKPEKRRGRCLCVVLLLLFAVAAVFGVSWAACETKMAVSGREREVLEAVCVPYEKGVEVVSDVAEVARTWWEKEVVMEKPAEKEMKPAVEEEKPVEEEEKPAMKEEKHEEKEEKPEEKEEIPAEKEMNPVEEETPMEEDPPFLAEVLDTVLSSREIAFLRRNAVPAVIVLILLFFVTAIALRNQNATSSSDDTQKKEPSRLEQNPEEDSRRDVNLGVLDNTHAAQKDEVQ